LRRESCQQQEYIFLTNIREILGLNKTLANTPGYTKAVDMWSLGCVTIVLLTGGTIFIDPKKNEYCEKLASECNLDQLNSDPDWQYVGKRPKDFVRRLMVLDENERMTAKQALQHHWFTNDVNRKDFEDVYERGIKNWKSRMTIGPVVEDFVVPPEQKGSTPKLVSKKSKRSAGVPIEPPYRPFPRNFNSPFLPKKRSWNNLDDYIRSSRERSLDPDHVPDTDLDAIISEDDIKGSQDLPPAGPLNISTLRKPNTTFQPLKRLFLKPLPLKPLIIAKEDDCDTPMDTTEDVFKIPSTPHAPSKKGVLREDNSKPNKQWPFSPGAWSKGLRSSSSSKSDSTLSRTITREFTPINSKFHGPPPKRLKFVPLRPVTPLSRRTLSEDSPDPPEPGLWKDRAEAGIANLTTRMPTLAMDRLSLRVPGLANVKKKRAGNGTAFDFDGYEGNEGMLVACMDPRSRSRSRKRMRKRGGNVFDIPDDEEVEEAGGESGSDKSGDEDDEKVEDGVLDGFIRSTREFSASFQSALDYGKQLQKEETSHDTVEEKMAEGDDGIDIFLEMVFAGNKDDQEIVGDDEAVNNDAEVYGEGYDPDPGSDREEGRRDEEVESAVAALELFPE
jgi:serine/threonine protein kinase